MIITNWQLYHHEEVDNGTSYQTWKNKSPRNGANISANSARDGKQKDVSVIILKNLF